MTERTEPTINCPGCGAVIRLTESLAAPLIAATRQQFEQQLRQKDAEVEKREADLRGKEKQITETKRTLDEQIAERVATQLNTERARVAAEEAKKAKRVSPTCLIHFERNRYSVPATFANCPVSLRVYSDRLVIAAEGAVLCEHRRLIHRDHRAPGQTVYDWRHYLAVIQRKPGALRNGAPFTELPDGFKALQQHLRGKPGGGREMVEILALVLQHTERDVLGAVELALSDGVPTKTHILNVLHRVLDGKSSTTPTIETPEALTLTIEPIADAARYDHLRLEQEVRHAP
jgi:hypothetical protein